MQAILLAAGRSSRFYPFNKNHKSEIELMGQVLIQKTVSELVKSKKVNEIIIVTSENSSIKNIDFEKLYKKIKFKFVIQEVPNGMGDALLRCKEIITGDFIICHAHHIDVLDYLENIDFISSRNGVLAVKKVSDVSSYGFVLVHDNFVKSVIEKPEKKEPGLVLNGVYFLPVEFIDYVKKFSSTGHYSFEHALDYFVKSFNVRYICLESSNDVSLKYPWDIFSCKNYLFNKITKNSISPRSKIHKSTQLSGEKIVIDEGVVILENCVIKGPCFIGKNSYIGNSTLIREGTVIEGDVKIGSNMEIRNSIIMKGASTHSGFIGDSIIGSGTKIAAGFITGNIRLDRGSISVSHKKSKVNSFKKRLGAIIGSDTNIGINVSVMPGVIIGNNCSIGPGTQVNKSIQDKTKYYSKIIGVVEKNINE